MLLFGVCFILYLSTLSAGKVLTQQPSDDFLFLRRYRSMYEKGCSHRSFRAHIVHWIADDNPNWNSCINVTRIVTFQCCGTTGGPCAKSSCRPWCLWLVGIFVKVISNKSCDQLKCENVCTAHYILLNKSYSIDGEKKYQFYHLTKKWNWITQ